MVLRGVEAGAAVVVAACDGAARRVEQLEFGVVERPAGV